MRRNSIITSRTSEHVTSASANVSESNIRKWFNDIHQNLKGENLTNILNNPKIICNGADEIGFSLCPKTTDTGWMKAEVFYEFVANISYPYILENIIELPVILFVNGHKRHLTFNLSELCIKLKIIFIALYPNVTRILQPADIAAFQLLKAVRKRWFVNEEMKILTEWLQEKILYQS